MTEQPRFYNKLKRNGTFTILAAVFLLFIYSNAFHESSNSTFHRYDCAGAFDMEGVDKIVIQKKSYNFLNPPQLYLTDFERNPNSNNTLGLQELSELVQEQINGLQDSKDCEKGTVLCGHFSSCGLGCQIHHRAACLMISYAMGLPLIHETELEGVKWAYSTPWTDVMLPLGSSCNVSSSTYNWTWKHTSKFYSKHPHNLEFAWRPENAKSPDKLDFPLYAGIVVRNSLAEMVEQVHSNPLQWWASQFVKNVWQIRPKTVEKIRNDQASIGLQSDCIAFHVRRTDKKDESRKSVHNLEEYFSKAKNAVTKTGKRPQVFIASDDATVLPTAQEKYKDWNVVGFYSNQTLKNPGERNNFLYEILRDIVTLAHCETIICGLSSNICCLLQELNLNEDHKKIISLDGSYRYAVYGAILKSINKVDFKFETVV